ncbi:MAG: ROK family protein [Chloroflexi bacterium]|nr:ROK family protein [Chloroflexota bacterium]
MEEKRVVAVDFGGTKIRAALADGAGNILTRSTAPTQARKGPGAVIAKIAELVLEVMEGIPHSQVHALAVAAPGPLDSDAGVVLSPPNLPGWSEVPLAYELMERLELPVRVENDAKTAALGEYTFGQYKGIKNMVYLTVSTGIGGGVICDGRLLRGYRGMATEIGHMIIDPKGPECTCGSKGCLEAMASGTAIARDAIRVVSAGLPSAMDEMSEGKPENITAEIVVRAAVLGDAAASEIMRRATVSLGIGVANVMHLYSPEMVIIGGGVSRAGEQLLFEPVRQVAHERIMYPYRRQLRVMPATLGDDAGLLGAVALALEGMDSSGRAEM